LIEPRWLHTQFELPLSQRDVDFVVPRLDADLPLAIDPFLLYKAKRADLQQAHRDLVAMFESAFDAFRQGDEARARDLVRFPEVREIRFGYAEQSIQGAGVGEVLSGLTIDVLRTSPALLNRGIRHVEELQLFSVGIGPDRISDAVANVLKRFLVQYTAKQAALWDIPISNGVALERLWDPENRDWEDDFVSLPIDPVTGIPIILVPRWIVRRLPWINFPDFLRTDYARFLGARGRAAGGRNKPAAVAVTQHQVGLVDDYVRRKEREASGAQPDPPPLLAGAPFPAGDDLLSQIEALAPGLASAYEYQRLVLLLLNTLFEPELVDGEPQSRTASGVEIRDIVYTNNSDRPFLRFLQTEHGNLLLVFDCKNVGKLDSDDINQMANYLGDPLGRCGIIVTRFPPGESVLRKARATYNKASPRRVVLILADADLKIMVEMKRSGARHPVDHLQRVYRAFVQSIE
jgi:hypothetical protein